MEPEDLIPVKIFVSITTLNIHLSIHLEDSGLISVTSVRANFIYPLDEMQKLEKFVRLHYDLDINLEGLETINHLLEKIEEMQREILKLRNDNIRS